ncbi:MAG: hypothetical protein NVS3B5_01560 [Sphingomicrobium sp.]
MPMQSEIIADIRGWHRRRVAAMEIRKRADLALGANLRTWLGWRRDLEESKRKAIEALALDLIECGEIEAKRQKVVVENLRRVQDGKKPKRVPDAHHLADTEEYAEYRDFIGMAVLSREPTDRYEGVATKSMEDLARQLPVWPFAASIQGLGARSLAVIVGEAGDLSNYATHSKLWKRMAMAPYSKDGVTRSGQQWKIKGGLDKDDWIAFGYRARRRAQMFVIEGNLIKQTDAYYRLYLARKEYLRNRAVFEGKTVAPSAKIPKGADGYVSDGEINAQAKHYMGKKLLRDLWTAWRRANYDVPHNEANFILPAAENSDARAGEVSAKTQMLQGQLIVADTSTDAAQAAGEATTIVPAKADCSLPPRKSNAPKGAVSAGGSVPKGRGLFADTKIADASQDAEAASATVPKGQGKSASSKNTKAPRGAGRATTAVPVKAREGLLGHLSEDAL